MKRFAFIVWVSLLAHWGFGQGAYPQPAEKDGKWGYVNEAGTVVIPLMYDDAGDFSEGLAWVEKDEKYGYIDKNGTVVIPLMYDWAKSFSEGMAAVEKGGKYGYIDKNGKVVNWLDLDDIAVRLSKGSFGGVSIPDAVWPFSGGRALVRDGGKYGFIDKNRYLVIPLEYDDAESFSKGLARVKKDGKWFYINKKGEYVRDAD